MRALDLQSNKELEANREHIQKILDALLDDSAKDKQDRVTLSALMMRINEEKERREQP